MGGDVWGGDIWGNVPRHVEVVRWPGNIRRNMVRGKTVNYCKLVSTGVHCCTLLCTTVHYCTLLYTTHLLVATGE